MPDTLDDDLDAARMLVKAANDNPDPGTNAAVLSALYAVLRRLAKRVERLERDMKKGRSHGEGTGP